MRHPKLSSAMALLVGAKAALANPSFGYNATDFLLNGHPFQIIGGQMDPSRVPYQLWDDRMAMAKAMGLNTIFSYLYWDQLQPAKDKFATEGNSDIAAWVRSASRHGLKVVLRPGPYICGEHEWGGFPAWLADIKNMTVRSNNPQFLHATAGYLQFLGSWLEPYFASNGGPILMSQVENEYGFYSNDHAYTRALADIMRDAFPTVTLYTNDGSSKDALGAGAIPGILAETDGGIDGFAGRNQWIDPSSAGPYLDGEYYITWIDQWGTDKTHQDGTSDPVRIKNTKNDFAKVLKDGNSFSIYMFHGGTNWGFQNGADFDGRYEPITTSYDYGAPLDESGRPTEIYNAIRQTIIDHVGNRVPDVPVKPPMINIGPLTLKPYTQLFDNLGKGMPSHSPQNMEALGQSTGYILYRHASRSSVSGTLKLGDGPRDRAIIFLNGKRIGIIDAIYANPQVIQVTLKPHDTLDILVENLGRVNFGSLITDQRKGIVGNVTLGNTPINGFSIYNLPCDTPPAYNDRTLALDSVVANPTWYITTFDAHTLGDTYLSFPGWIKGVVYLNDINIGRFWTIGPQQSLYIPSVYLKHRNNVLKVLNLEPTGTEGPIVGSGQRTWGTNPDPDAPK